MLLVPSLLGRDSCCACPLVIVIRVIVVVAFAAMLLSTFSLAQAVPVFPPGAIRQNQAGSCLVVTENLIDIDDSARVG
ncbi:MAG: hypothetical protein ABSF66_11205 [Terriglobales bacterium]